MSDKNSANDGVAIKKIVVQVGRHDLILKVEDAKQLRDVLNGLFGQVIVEKQVTERNHYYGYPHTYYWNYPVLKYDAGTSNGMLSYSSSGEMVSCTFTAGSPAGAGGTASNAIDTTVEKTEAK